MLCERGRKRSAECSLLAKAEETRGRKRRRCIISIDADCLGFAMFKILIIFLFTMCVRFLL